MTRYEPHCDCLGGHVDMRPDPNGRWSRADDPRAVADDPSGIVQQMPEVATEALEDLRGRITPGPWDFEDRSDGCKIFCVYAGDRLVMRTSWHDDSRWFPGKAQSRVNAEAVALLPDLLDEVITRRATEADLRAEVDRLRAALTELADACEAYPVNVPRADAALSAARAALSPETDGGQDG